MATWFTDSHLQALALERGVILLHGNIKGFSGTPKVRERAKDLVCASSGLEIGAIRAIYREDSHTTRQRRAAICQRERWGSELAPAPSLDAGLRKINTIILHAGQLHSPTQRQRSASRHSRRYRAHGLWSGMLQRTTDRRAQAKLLIKTQTQSRATRHACRRQASHPIGPPLPIVFLPLVPPMMPTRVNSVSRNCTLDPPHILTIVSMHAARPEPHRISYQHILSSRPILDATPPLVEPAVWDANAGRQDALLVACPPSGNVFYTFPSFDVGEMEEWDVHDAKSETHMNDTCVYLGEMPSGPLCGGPAATIKYLGVVMQEVHMLGTDVWV